MARHPFNPKLQRTIQGNHEIRNGHFLLPWPPYLMPWAVPVLSTAARAALLVGGGGRVRRRRCVGAMKSTAPPHE